LPSEDLLATGGPVDGGGFPAEYCLPGVNGGGDPGEPDEYFLPSVPDATGGGLDFTGGDEFPDEYCLPAGGLDFAAGGALLPDEYFFPLGLDAWGGEYGLLGGELGFVAKDEPGLDEPEEYDLPDEGRLEDEDDRLDDEEELLPEEYDLPFPAKASSGMVARIMLAIKMRLIKRLSIFLLPV
jgi:hypothetical protein